MVIQTLFCSCHGIPPRFSYVFVNTTYNLISCASFLHIPFFLLVIQIRNLSSLYSVFPVIEVLCKVLIVFPIFSITFIWLVHLSLHYFPQFSIWGGCKRNCALLSSLPITGFILCSLHLLSLFSLPLSRPMYRWGSLCLYFNKKQK